MREKTKRWASFALGLALGAGGTSTAIVAADCSPSVKITQAVVDAYCIGREQHVCPNPCPTVPTCPDPCPELSECDGSTWSLEVVPAAADAVDVDPSSANTVWTWYVPDEVKLEIDWSIVATPDFEQAVATFAFRWKEEQAIRPVLAASWTEGIQGYSTEMSYCLSWSGCDVIQVPGASDDWRVLLGVSGTFGK